MVTAAGAGCAGSRPASSSRSFRSRAARGSSRRRTRGWKTRARARATRCCWPPESCAGTGAPGPGSWTRSRAPATRVGPLGPGHLPHLAEGRPRCPATVRWGRGRSSGTPCRCSGACGPGPGRTSRPSIRICPGPASTKPGHHAEDGGLAGARGPQEATRTPPAATSRRHPVTAVTSPIALDEVHQFQMRLGGGLRPSADGRRGRAAVVAFRRRLRSRPPPRKRRQRSTFPGATRATGVRFPCSSARSTRPASG